MGVKTVADNRTDDPFEVIAAMAALACEDHRALVDPPENGDCGVVGCWFGDGSFGAAIIDPKSGRLLTSTHDTVPQELLTEHNLHKKLRHFLSNELLFQR